MRAHPRRLQCCGPGDPLGGPPGGELPPPLPAPGLPLPAWAAVAGRALRRAAPPSRAGRQLQDLPGPGCWQPHRWRRQPPTAGAEQAGITSTMHLSKAALDSWQLQRTHTKQCNIPHPERSDTHAQGRSADGAPGRQPLPARSRLPGGLCRVCRLAIRCCCGGGLPARQRLGEHGARCAGHGWLGRPVLRLVFAGGARPRCSSLGQAALVRGAAGCAAQRRHRQPGHRRCQAHWPGRSLRPACCTRHGCCA